MVNQPDIQGYPDCRQPSLLGYSSCLSSISLFRVALLPDELYRLALWTIEPIDRVVWTIEPNGRVVLTIEWFCPASDDWDGHSYLHFLPYAY